MCRCAPFPTNKFVLVSPRRCANAIVSANLQVQCLSNSTRTAITTGGGGTIIISPLFNITRDDFGNNTDDTFVFTLPIDPSLIGNVVSQQGCYGQQLSCEWQNPESLEFLQSGCAVSKERVDLGSGIVGTQCTCTHLTVFAIVLRPQLRASPLCHAQEVDYALLALYCILACVLLVQTIRIFYYKLYKSSLPQHLLLLLASVLRVVYLVLKPVIGSLAGLVLLGLLPLCHRTDFVHSFAAGVGELAVEHDAVEHSFRQVPQTFCCNHFDCRSLSDSVGGAGRHQTRGCHSSGWFVCVRRSHRAGVSISDVVWTRGFAEAWELLRTCLLLLLLLPLPPLPPLLFGEVE